MSFIVIFIVYYVMNKQLVITFEDCQQTIETSPGRKLIDICDDLKSPILFGCRACSCGTCLIEITKGEENISPATEQEKLLLSVIAQDNSQARLACQCTINGSVSIKTP